MAISGFILVDKPKGISSFFCLKKIRKVANMKRVGFVGTLDPLASGLMVFAVGEATKLIPLLEGTDKVYNVTVQFGATSDTYDKEGTVTEFINPKNPKLEQIEAALNDSFLGEQDQMPPAFSAIQVDGVRAYELARKNEKVNLKTRKVTFYDFEINTYKWPFLDVTLKCSSGTYVRSFAHDLGQILNCGGMVQDLRRLEIGHFSINDAANWEDLSAENLKSHLMPIEKVFPDMPVMKLTEKEYKILANGGFIAVGGKLEKDEMLAMFNDNCAGILEKKQGKLKFKRKLNIVA